MFSRKTRFAPGTRGRVLVKRADFELHALALPFPPPLLLSPCQSSLVFRVVSHELLYRCKDESRSSFRLYLASIASERPPTSFLYRRFWSLTTTAVVRKPLKSHLFMAKISLSLSVIWYFSQWSYATSLGYTRYDGMMVSYTHVCPVASPGTYDGTCHTCVLWPCIPFC